MKTEREIRLELATMESLVRTMKAEGAELYPAALPAAETAVFTLMWVLS